MKTPDCTHDWQPKPLPVPSLYDIEECTRCMLWRRATSEPARVLPAPPADRLATVDAVLSDLRNLMLAADEVHITTEREPMRSWDGGLEPGPFTVVTVRMTAPAGDAK